MSGPEAVAALAAERVDELRRQIDYLASTVALLPASPRRAAARAAVQAIDRDVAELLRQLGVDQPLPPPQGSLVRAPPVVVVSVSGKRAALRHSPNFAVRHEAPDNRVG
jgi:hypothetical protein